MTTSEGELCKHLGFQLKQMEGRKFELSRLQQLEHLQEKGQNISSTRNIPQVTLTEFYAPVKKRMAFGVD